MKQVSNLFRTADGRNHAVTFMLICTLFLLWGFCNGLIDTLNKHFQNSLSVSKTQSALVQMANYMGYFLMAIPSGLLARRFGYKGGIMIGLVLIATGAFWFIPAVHIGTYWAFLTGLFILATGLTCLETIANPYTTVLGPPEAGATRINLAQSCNGIGWIIGPIIGGFFLFSGSGEVNRSNENLYKPYLMVGIIVTILIVIFAFSNVPDLQAEDEAKAEGGNGGGATSGKPLFKRWHFTMAVVAQFLYVAAQTGIFSFFINYVVSDTPTLSQVAAAKMPAKMTYSAAMFAPEDIKDAKGLYARLRQDADAKTQPVSQFLWGKFATNTQALAVAVEADQKTLVRKQVSALETEFNRILQTNTLYEAQRFAGVTLAEETKKLIAQNPQGETLARLNRRLLEDTYPASLIVRNPYLNASLFRISEQGATLLLSVGGFGLFLLGRFTGSGVLRFCKAHSTLAVYCVLSAAAMVLVIMPWGWLSLAGLFMSFFFMSIMFPTIFALGIRGLGEHTKLASSLIVMAIVGGAIMPLWMGWLADTYSMRVGFLMPMICFIGVAVYAAFWPKLEMADTGHAVTD
ncbi:MAG: MFS transporter [Verrucomicrobiota bacterium]